MMNLAIVKGLWHSRCGGKSTHWEECSPGFDGAALFVENVPTFLFGGPFLMKYSVGDFSIKILLF
jgi:hypothetical protein